MTRIGVAATAPFGADVLERLARTHDVAWVLTRPDRPAGRGRKTTAPAAKVAAEQLGLEVRQPEKPQADDIAGVDTIVLVAYGGRAFYREQRISRGRTFGLLKFRTLRREVLGRTGGHARPLEADPANLTWLGRRILKPWYLDEVPQLWNVLRGDFSLVGPRPWPPELVEHQRAEGLTYRDEVPAGLTGLAQRAVPGRVEQILRTAQVGGLRIGHGHPVRAGPAFVEEKALHRTHDRGHVARQPRHGRRMPPELGHH